MTALLDNRFNLYKAYNRAVEMVSNRIDTFTKCQKIIRIIRQIVGYIVINNYIANVCLMILMIF